MPRRSVRVPSGTVTGLWGGAIGSSGVHWRAVGGPLGGQHESFRGLLGRQRMPKGVEGCWRALEGVGGCWRESEGVG